jgi:predicted transcriptional regulator
MKEETEQEMPRRRAQFEIVVRKIELPNSNNPREEFQWLCRSFGFFEEIDKDKTAASVFKKLIEAAERNKPLTSTEISEDVGMSRGAIINHLNNLQRAGLIEKQGRHYIARSRNVSTLIDEIESDIDAVFARMRRIAKQIDSEFDNL